jgi:O-antigen ligase
MGSSLKSINLRLVSLLLLGIPLVITPGLNEDATTIPKLIFLSVICANFIPLIIFNLKSFFNDKELRKVLTYAITMLIQLILVLLLTKAPLEQKFFGRPYRLIGFLTFFFVLLLFLVTYIMFEKSNYTIVLNLLALSGFISSTYAFLQYYGVDFMRLKNTSNLAVGPMGLTNFQSAFTAITLVPTIYVIYSKFKNYFAIMLVSIFYVLTVYFTGSIQGFIGMVLGLTILLLLFLLIKHKTISIIFGISCFTIFGTLFAGMLGHGYFAQYLYKDSVQSRGDFWRSATRISNENPIFGVGFDSFPDHYFRYKDQVTANRSWYENSDSAHNYFLDFSAQLGYPFSLLYLGLTLWVFYMFIQYFNKSRSIDFKLYALFCAWLVMQSTALINPVSIPLFAWNMALSGTLLKVTSASNSFIPTIKFIHSLKFASPMSPIRLMSSVLVLLLVFPIYNSDRSYLEAKKNLDLSKMIEVTNSYPKSSERFRDLSRTLMVRKEFFLSLEVARAATRFNPNHAAAWALILINPVASIDEKINAKREVLRLDPLNKQFKDFKIAVSN